VRPGYALLLGALLLAPFGAASYRLNRPFPLAPDGDVQFFASSPDAAWIVYSAEDVYSVPTDGSSAPLNLSQIADSTLSIASLEISPDGARVLYTVQPLGGRSTLYSVPIDGSAAPVDLTGPHITAYKVTPNSSRVLFRSDTLTENRFLLWSIPIDGSAAAIILNGPLPAGGDVNAFTITPDGTRVVYQAAGFFSAPVDASGGEILLDPASVLPDFRLGAGGSRVVYRSGFISELFSVPVDGSALPLRLNPPLTGNQDVEQGFVLTPDGSRAVYRVDQNTNDTIELYSVPIDGSAPAVRLNAPLVGGGDVQPGMQVSADGLRVVYRADQDTDEVFELFGVPTDGSALPTKLSGALGVDEDVHPEFVLVGGAGVAFLVGPASAATLLRAPLDGSSAPVALDSDPQFRFRNLSFAAVGSRVLYVKPDITGEHLWSVPLGGGPPIPLSTGEDLLDYRPILGGAGVLFAADQDRRTVFELFARPSNGSAPALQVSAEFPDNVVSGSVYAFSTVGSIAGERAIYVADPNLSDARGIYSVPISLHTPQHVVTHWSGLAIDVFPSLVFPPAIGAGGTRVVFQGRTAGLDSPGGFSLYSAPLDGSSSAVQLDAPVNPASSVTGFRLSADGSRVVYQADLESNRVYELYRSQVDGSGGTVKLSGPLGPGSDVQAGFQVNADGSRAVYVANEVGNQFELFSADGVSPRVKLSGVLIPEGDVELDPQIAPDGSFVVYRADANVDGKKELFRVPIDGSSAPVKLSGNEVVALGVQEFRITPDGTRVLFRAGGLPSGREALFVVPADASAASLQLNMLTNGLTGVSEFELDPSGTRVVFRNDPLLGNHRLFSVPLDGSSPEIELTPFSGNRYVVQDSWQISPDGSRVVYVLYTVSTSTNNLLSAPILGGAPPVVLDTGAIERGASENAVSIDPSGQRVAFLDASRRLFVVPIDRSSEPEELSPPLPPFSSGVADDLTFTQDGSQVLFRLDLRQAGSFDLYATPGRHGARTAERP